MAELANRQQGNVTRAQIDAAGFGSAWVDRRLRQGWLFRVHKGVYSVGRPPHIPIQFASAAVLACGPGAALSHFGALVLWGFAKRWPTTFEVIVAEGCDYRPKGITTHRFRGLTRADIRTHRGIRVTSPARTVLDILPCLDVADHARTVNDALHSSLLTRNQLLDVRRRFPNHPGAVLLDPHLDQTAGGITLSMLEDTFLAFCRRYQFPTPKTNQRAAAGKVDAVFPGHNLIVELDSWEYHRDRQAFETDRARDAANLAGGRPTVRITWQRLHHQPEREAELLERMLELY